MPRGRNANPSRRRYKYATSLEKNAFWTKPVAEGVKKPGPKKRHLVYKEYIDEVLNSPFLDVWRTGNEIATQATKKVSKYWTPISVYVVSNYIRIYVKEGKILKRKPNTISNYEYKRV